MAELNKNQSRGFSGEWITLCDLVRFSGGENGTQKTAKGIKLTKNSGNIFIQAYEGQNRITIKPSDAEAMLLAMTLIKNYFNGG